MHDTRPSPFLSSTYVNARNNGAIIDLLVNDASLASSGPLASDDGANAPQVIAAEHRHLVKHPANLNILVG